MERAGIEIVNLICDNRKAPDIIEFGQPNVSRRTRQE
jgi:hypothetical protein